MTIKVAAIQLATAVAESEENIRRCERLSLQAVNEGAQWIALPEFFNTGVSWNPKIARAIQSADGEAATFLCGFSKKYRVLIGGSFLCRLPDGQVRNRYQCYAQGRLVGQHDKDIPTMWENYFYEGGDPGDIGVLGLYENVRVGAAVCWEFMRTMTARRLQNKVDVVIGGSCWWSIPTNFPLFLQKLWEPDNKRNALEVLRDNARILGVPVIHAAHCGEIECAMPGLPMSYTGFYEGNAVILDAEGRILAHRKPEEGEGVVSTEILMMPKQDSREIPQGYWLRKRGILPFFAWHHQRWLGRRWYARHVRGN